MRIPRSRAPCADGGEASDGDGTVKAVRTAPRKRCRKTTVRMSRCCFRIVEVPCFHGLSRGWKKSGRVRKQKAGRERDLTRGTLRTVPTSSPIAGDEPGRSIAAGQTCLFRGLAAGRASRLRFRGHLRQGHRGYHGRSTIVLFGLERASLKIASRALVAPAARAIIAGHYTTRVGARAARLRLGCRGDDGIYLEDEVWSRMPLWEGGVAGKGWAGCAGCVATAVFSARAGIMCRPGCANCGAQNGACSTLAAAATA